MSNIFCETCGITQVDSPAGYVEGCIHHPPHRPSVVQMDFGDGWVDGAYDNGGFAYSRESAAQNKYVHPYRWKLVSFFAFGEGTA